MTMADKTPTSVKNGAAVATKPAATEKPKDTAEKAPKTCPVTKEQFLKDAKPVMVTIGDKQMIANPKSAEKLADGSSFGWYCGDKIVMMIDGVPVTVMVGLNLTVVNSKTSK